MRKTTYFLLLSFLFITLGYSQNELWKIDLQEHLYEVGWITQSNDGFIIASGSKGLLALDNTNGKIVWHNKEFKGIDKNTFLNIDGLPLFYFEYSPVIGKARGIIMNSSNGDIVFDTKDEGYRIKNFNLFPEIEKIIFELVKNKRHFLMGFSLKTWKKEWITDVGKNKEFLKKALRMVLRGGSALQTLQSRESFINHGPFFNKNKDLMMIGIGKEIYMIDPSSGKIKWKYEANKRITALTYSETNNSVYVGIRKSRNLKVLDPNKGEDITPGKLKLRGTLIDVLSDNDGNLIVVETEGFNIINPKTNTFKWKKSFKIEYLDEVIPLEKRFLAIGKEEKKSTVALVDIQGKKIWKSKISGYAYYSVPTKKGVLYISTNRSNILSYDRGKDVWNKDVKFRSIPAVTYDEKEEKVILFENKKGYKFDLTSGNIDLFAKDIKLEHVKKKTPLIAEYIEGSGYLLYTQQHISLLSPSGKKIYSTYYKPASDLTGFLGLAESGLAFATGVDLDIAGSLENIRMLSALSSGVYSSSQDQRDGTVEESTVAGMYIGDDRAGFEPVFEIVKKRYSNTKTTKTHKFIITKVKNNNAPTKHAIYMVNKKTGVVDNKINLLDKTPNYIIDEVDNVVFLNEKNHLVSSHKF